MKSILVIGEICYDVIMHYPNSVEVYGHNIWAENIVFTYGGSAAITSAALASLGENVKIVGTVGNDDEGQQIISMLEKEGVDCSLVTVQESTATTKSLLQCDGDRKVFLGCSPMLKINIPITDVLDGTSLIYVAGFVLYPELGTDEAFHFFGEARKRGIPIIVDGQCFSIPEVDGNLHAITRLPDMISLSNVFLAAEKEWILFKKEQETDDNIAGKLLRSGTEQVIVKHGKQGAALYTEDGMVSAPGCKVNAYDTIGSGDIFGAAYTYGYLHQWDKERCIRFATVFAALSLERYEKTKNFPTIATVEHRMIKEFGG